MMRPTSARFSHDHGSASRRRSSYAVSKATKKVTPVTTPAEKRALVENAQESAKEVIQAA